MQTHTRLVVGIFVCGFAGRLPDDGDAYIETIQHSVLLFLFLFCCFNALLSSHPPASLFSSLVAVYLRTTAAAAVHCIVMNGQDHGASLRHWRQLPLLVSRQANLALAHSTLSFFFFGVCVGGKLDHSSSNSLLLAGSKKGGGGIVSCKRKNEPRMQEQSNSSSSSVSLDRIN